MYASNYTLYILNDMDKFIVYVSHTYTQIQNRNNTNKYLCVHSQNCTDVVNPIRFILGYIFIRRRWQRLKISIVNLKAINTYVRTYIAR